MFPHQECIRFETLSSLRQKMKRPLNEGASEVEWKNLEESMINFKFEALSTPPRLAQAWCKFLIR